MTTSMLDAELLAFPSRPADRLRRALRRLEIAVAEQGVAVEEFRTDLSALSSAVAGLDASMQTYRDRLNDTAGATRQAQTAARRMDALAEAMLRK
jgi:uncharacterized coiled-coil protein SlyX